MDFKVMGLFLKLDMLTLNNTIYSDCIQLHLGEILVSLEVVLSKKAKKWLFLLNFQ